MITLSANTTTSAPGENLKRLLSLRALNISGQLIAILTTIYYLEMALPVKPLAAILVGQVVWSVSTLFLLKDSSRITDEAFFYQLISDVVALTGILYFTGGATNPFAWFLLVPHSIAATLLSQRYVWLMALLTSLSYSLIVFYYQPLVHINNPVEVEAGGHFKDHVIGMWIGFLLSIFLLAYFVAGMAQSLRKRNELLSTMKERMFRDERLIALGTLATGAAHELGTPLGTMDVLAHELELDFQAAGDKAASSKLSILQGQIKRCKKVLSTITERATSEKYDSGQLLAIDEYLANVVAQWRISNINVPLIEKVKGVGHAPKLITDLALTRALINVLDNAARVSPEYVKLVLSWTDSNIHIRIEDRGCGIDEAQLLKLGKHMMSSKDKGLGLGVYITQATLERLGGSIKWENHQPKGVCVSICIPVIA